MIEQAFQQKGTVGGINRSSSTGSPKSKRQKTHLSKMQRAISKMKASTIPEVSIVSDSDDDDDMFDLDSITSHYMGSGGGTTSARGTGYDGRVNEDVRQSILTSALLGLTTSRDQVKWLPSGHRGKRISRRLSFWRKSASTCLPSIEQAEPAVPTTWYTQSPLPIFDGGVDSSTTCFEMTRF